jgi:P-type conjugative transfer protein TrbG
MRKIITSILGGVVCVTVVGTVLAQGTGKRYLKLDDAAVEMARAWQRGDKAKPLMSDDGKVVFAYGASMPKLTCSPTRACDVEMQPGEKINKVVLGDKVNWTWAPAESMEKGLPVQHLVIQPRDSALESNAIITTNRRTYHIKLYAPKQEGVYLNRVGFYYPDEIVESWESRAGTQEAVQAKEDNLRVTEESFSPENLDFDYRISGTADFRPLRVFNTGKQVYFEIPAAVLKSGEAPIMTLIDEEGKSNVVNYRTRGNHYIVDKLFKTAELVVGTEKVTVLWNKKAGWFWSGWGAGS